MAYTYSLSRKFYDSARTLQCCYRTCILFYILFGAVLRSFHNSNFCYEAIIFWKIMSFNCIYLTLLYFVPLIHQGETAGTQLFNPTVSCSLMHSTMLFYFYSWRGKCMAVTVALTFVAGFTYTFPLKDISRCLYFVCHSLTKSVVSSSWTLDILVSQKIWEISVKYTDPLPQYRMTRLFTLHVWCTTVSITIKSVKKSSFSCV